MSSREDFRVFLGLARIEVLVATRGALIPFMIFAMVAFVLTLCLTLDWNVFTDDAKDVTQARSEIFSHDFKHQASEVYFTWSARSNELHVNRPEHSLIHKLLEYRSKALKMTERSESQPKSSSPSELFLTGNYNLPAGSLGYQGDKDADPALNQLMQSTRFGSWTYVPPGAEEMFFKRAGLHYGSALFIIPDHVSRESLRVHLYEPEEQDTDNMKLVESAVSSILDKRATTIFYQHVKDLGLPSDTFNSPSVKVIAKRLVPELTHLAARPVALNDTQAQQSHIRISTFIFWILAIDMGSMCGPVYLSIWTKRQAEGGFEMYAKSPHAAWSMCAAQPAAVALLHGCPLILGTALGWIVAFSVGHGSTMISLLNVILCILVIGCAALMSVFITLASLSFSSHPILRRWLGLFPLFILGAINFGGVWDFSGEIFTQAVQSFSPTTALKTMGTMLVISLISLWIAHVRTGRFCRMIWQSKPKN